MFNRIKEYFRRNKKYAIVSGVVTILLVLATCIVAPMIASLHTEEYTSKVLWKEYVGWGHIWNQHKYVIYTMEVETGDIVVFENVDDVMRGKYNSSDYYAIIEIGETYTFTVAGYRIPFLTMYQNIIDVN
jgi:hypothetical protein